MSGSDRSIDGVREAFGLLDHDLRLEILLALLDRWRAAHTDPQRYSELMRAVGTEDSGKFNYHLQRLRGVYLRKVDGGYAPTASATALYRAVLATRPTDATQPTVDPNVACPDCGEPLTATYDRDFLTVRCPACGSARGEFTYPFPKNGLDGRTDEAVVRAVFERARAQVGLARRGQCPDCAGQTTCRIRTEAVADGAPAVGISCDTCTWVVRTGALLPLLADARVAAALVEAGVPVETGTPRELPEPTATLAATDPPELELRVEGPGGTATVRVDGDLDVLAVDVTEQGPDGSSE